LFVSVLHFVGDPDVHQAVARFTSAAASGIYLVLSHGTSDRDPQAVAAAATTYQGTASPATPRTREAILDFFTGPEVLQPGLVPVVRWRTDDPGQADIVPEQAIQGTARRHRSEAGPISTRDCNLTDPSWSGAGKKS
jgi:hypothetical protein